MNRTRRTGREARQQASRPDRNAKLQQGELQAVAAGIIEVYPK